MSNYTNSFRDVELISAYLDGQLSKVEQDKIVNRLKNEVELVNLLEDINYSISIMRKLPGRKAPKNFTLSPKMAGVKPPVPRVFPVFRLASTFAGLLFILAFTANLSFPALSNLGLPFLGMAAANRAIDQSALESPALAPADFIPLETGTPEVTLLMVLPTQSLEVMATPEVVTQPETQAKMLPPVSTPIEAEPIRQPIQLPIPAFFQYGLLGVAVVSGAGAYFLRFRSENNWFRSQSIIPPKLGVSMIVVVILVLAVVVALTLAINIISNSVFYVPIP